MSREEMRAERGAESGAGYAGVRDAEVGRERVLKEAVGDRGVSRAERVEERGNDVAGVLVVVEGVTIVERKAVRRLDEWTVTGTSSRMLDGTSLWSIKLWVSNLPARYASTKAEVSLYARSPTWP